MKKSGWISLLILTGLFIGGIYAVSSYLDSNNKNINIEKNTQADELNTVITGMSEEVDARRAKRLKRTVMDQNIISAEALALLSYSEIDAFLSDEHGRVLWLYADGDTMFIPYDEFTPGFKDETVDEMVEGLKTPNDIKKCHRLRPWFELNMYYNARLAAGNGYKIIIVADTQLPVKLFPEIEKYMLTPIKDVLTYKSSLGRIIGTSLVPVVERYGGIAMPCTSMMTRSIDSIVGAVPSSLSSPLSPPTKCHCHDDSDNDGDSNDDHSDGPCRCHGGHEGARESETDSRMFFSSLSWRQVKSLYSRRKFGPDDFIKYPVPSVFGRVHGKLDDETGLAKDFNAGKYKTPIYDTLIANLKKRGHKLANVYDDTATDLSDEGQLALRIWHEYVLSDLDMDSIDVLDPFYTLNAPAPDSPELEFRNQEYFETAPEDIRRILTFSVEKKGFIPFFDLPYDRIYRESEALDNDVLSMELRKTKNGGLIPDGQISDTSLVNIFYGIMSKITP